MLPAASGLSNKHPLARVLICFLQVSDQVEDNARFGGE